MRPHICCISPFCLLASHDSKQPCGLSNRVHDLSSTLGSKDKLFVAEEMNEAEEEPQEWVDDGSLPLNKEGQLLFYFLDAHEDANLPHTVYLFGKVHPTLHLS